MHTLSTAVAASGPAHRARRGLAIYLAVVAALTAPLQALIVAADLDGGANGAGAWLALIAPLMFVPAVASVVARLALREGFADVSFRLGGRRGRVAVLLALAFPLAIGLPAYGVAWATGLVGFAPPPLVGWVVTFVVGSILTVVLAAGEEIGWRGYMLTRLIDAGVPRPVLASGLIWGAWHLPLVLWAGYAAGPSPLLAAALFLVAITATGFVYARLRLATGSVWPAIALHTAWDAIIQTGFDPATTGGQKALWTGESGLLTALALVVAAVIVSRGRWAVSRTPPPRGTVTESRTVVRV